MSPTASSQFIVVRQLNEKPNPPAMLGRME